MLRSPEVRVFEAVQRAANRLNLHFAQLLRGYGVSPSQYEVLRVLRAAGAEGLACSQVGSELLTPDPDMTRLLDRLEQKGWTARARSLDDRRRVQVRLTPAGQKLADSLDRVVQRHHAAVLGALGPSRLNAVGAALESWLESEASK